jgi:hypothetical protein
LDRVLRAESGGVFLAACSCWVLFWSAVVGLFTGLRASLFSWFFILFEVVLLLLSCVLWPMSGRVEDGISGR